MSEQASLGTVAIVGVGLIGGSLALALKKAAVVDAVIGVDQSRGALHQALDLGVIDEIGEWSDLTRADVIVLATPVDALFSVCQGLHDLDLRAGVVVTDVGSTKGSVLAAMREAYGEVPAWFVPGHPIAGRERSGVGAAAADLFHQHKVIVTTLPETDDAALGVVSRMWHATGALVSFLSIDDHDEVLGATSHLPHVLAYLLVDMLKKDLHHEEIFSYAAGGFRDFTRIASSSPVMWRDVCLHNPEVLKRLIANYRSRLVAFEQLLDDGDGERIEALFLAAKRARDAHYQLDNES
ncbi:prephenate dehydrogenase/arogenate dehydrogenase family protein [Suttonella sp. R2A3]|uniref:prephenate dehydrogenase n=1 Tax=Suttonella sp. R2A3 TaxID=2908648 RepID=UPI001F2492F2|nr:prephenate dehydrogenase/arogenate dehydrogenase family protein [Suttonella sp. R2A3]UJF24622.1 prephenate dehydrogenase/arogenate dehydrogenase family protein [Suttonella sp. R2A3]